MTQFLLMLGTVLASLSAVPYIVAIVRHQVRPRLVSWLIWTVLAIIITVTSVIAGEEPSAFLSGVTALSCGSVLVLGWRRATWQVTRFDMVCLSGAAIGIAAYFTLGGSTALIISVMIDALAFVPTLIHGYSDPDEESISIFALTAVADVAILVAAIMSHASFTGVLYPVYSLIFNSAMAVIIVVGRLERWSNTESESGYDIIE